jgi:hypothetical protein
MDQLTMVAVLAGSCVCGQERLRGLLMRVICRQALYLSSLSRIAASSTCSFALSLASDFVSLLTYTHTSMKPTKTKPISGRSASIEDTLMNI